MIGSAGHNNRNVSFGAKLETVDTLGILPKTIENKVYADIAASGKLFENIPEDSDTYSFAIKSQPEKRQAVLYLERMTDNRMAWKPVSFRQIKLDGIKDWLAEGREAIIKKKDQI